MSIKDEELRKIVSHNSCHSGRRCSMACSYLHEAGSNIYECSVFLENLEKDNSKPIRCDQCKDLL